jgi:transposase
MDNGTFHKTRMVINFLTTHTITYAFLPKYSPDLNPIEQTWFVCKHTQRSLGLSPDATFRKMLHHNTS